MKTNARITIIIISIILIMLSLVLGAIKDKCLDDIAERSCVVPIQRDNDIYWCKKDGIPIPHIITRTDKSRCDWGWWLYD